MIKEVIETHDTTVARQSKKDMKKKLIAFAWTSSSFQTRGGKTTVSDGDQRLLQWLEFKKMVRVEHLSIYDNSGVSFGYEFVEASDGSIPRFCNSYPLACQSLQ